MCSVLTWPRLKAVRSRLPLLFFSSALSHDHATRISCPLFTSQEVWPILLTSVVKIASIFFQSTGTLSNRFVPAVWARQVEEYSSSSQVSRQSDPFSGPLQNCFNALEGSPAWRNSDPFPALIHSNVNMHESASISACCRRLGSL